MSKGKLYIVSTPIGNLSDITVRALDIIKSVPLIISEDTRETDKLLKHYQIENRQISYRDQNHNRVAQFIYETLDLGMDVALMSDSGTPLISDPGFKLVVEAIEKGYEVISIPGPSAVVSALSVSGLPTDKFTFLGFLPRSKGQRTKLIEEYGRTESTLIFYESPYRVGELLEEIYQVLGNRKCAIVNDLTKLYEKVSRGKLEDLLPNFVDKKLKGEFVILVAKEDF